MRQLLGFVIGDAGYDARVGHLTRVRGEDPGNVRPDLDLIGVEGGAQKGRAVVGAASSQRGRRTIGARPMNPVKTTV